MAFFQSLEAFWPGMLAGIGDIEPAYRSLMHYMNLWRHYGFTPEFFDVVKAKVVRGREGYPLRPGTVRVIRSVLGTDFVIFIGLRTCRTGRKYLPFIPRD